MSGHDEAHTSTMQRPNTYDRDAWQGYWRAQGQPWRTEPEIDLERQRVLTAHVTALPGSEQNPSPFKDMPLSRADVEWLLATYEDGRGPVDWGERSQRARFGINLCGADLRRADLRGLPLARVHAGLPWFRRNFHTSEQLDEVGVRLEKADLRGTHLEGAILRGAHLEHADLQGAFLEEADLSRAHLESADLPEAHLEDAVLIRAHLEGTHLREAHLEGADLRRAFLDFATNLDGTSISNSQGESALLAGIHWGGVDLTMLNWAQVKLLGDEQRVRRNNERRDEDRREGARRLTEY